MRPPIYRPKGAALEYGEWALNIYEGCPHRCPYCYVPLVLHKDRETFHANVSPRPGIVEETRKQLERTGMTGETIHLCFTCDPFPSHYDCTPTLDIIRLLKEHGNHVQILTKGDGNCALDLLDKEDWYGITVDETRAVFTRASPAHSTFRRALSLGIKTWISFEPVLYPETVLLEIESAAKLGVDRVKIGKLNYGKPPNPINWAAFGREAEALCQELGLDYYIKSSLRKEMEKT